MGSITWAPSVSSAMTSVSLSAAVARWGMGPTSSNNAEPIRTRSRMGTRSSSGKRPHSRGGRRTVSTRIWWRRVLRSGPETSMATTAEMSRNMRLLAQNDLGGFGNDGEGMVIQLARDGRRVLWLAHESAPQNVTAVDVTDPRKPSVILQTDLPHGDMRSNNLELLGDLLIVPYQTSRVGLKPAGVEFFDVSDPNHPKSVAFFDASGPHSRS